MARLHWRSPALAELQGPEVTTAAATPLRGVLDSHQPWTSVGPRETNNLQRQRTKRSDLMKGEAKGGQRQPRACHCDVLHALLWLPSSGLCVLDDVSGFSGGGGGDYGQAGCTQPPAWRVRLQAMKGVLRGLGVALALLVGHNVLSGKRRKGKGGG